LQFAVTAFHKNKIDQNFREIANFKKLDLCPIYEHIENFPLISGSVNWWNATFPNLVHKCPYKVILNSLSFIQPFQVFIFLQNFRIVNGIVSKMSETSWLGTLLSNGLYKLVSRYFDDEDEKILSYTVFIEIWYHDRSVANV
jgi:hypothetical protein